MSTEGHSCGPETCWECGESHGCVCANCYATETDARQEAERIEQSNDIAQKVIEVARSKAPSEFVTLNFRYGIADALWDAGYRKVEHEKGGHE